MKSQAQKKVSSLGVQRGTVVALKNSVPGATNLAIIVSNDMQNESSDVLLAVPLQRRVSRLKAPFAVDLGRADGMRDLHSARCDWLMRIERGDLEKIERAAVSARVMDELEAGLRVALGFREII